MNDQEQAEAVAQLVKSYVDTALAPIKTQIATIEQAVKDIPPARAGADGKDGINGKDADTTAIEADLRARLKEINAAMEAFDERIASVPTPKDGRDGRDGRDGIDGKDGLEIAVLPSIDEQKSYAKGTFANHKGGIFRAARQTKGMDGWECIISGIVSTDAEYNGEREFSLSIERSSGEIDKIALDFPMPIYRNVYKDGVEYKGGDVVTWAGSLWICGTDTKEKPGESKDWTLCVKKGRDGKDGKP